AVPVGQAYLDDPTWPERFRNNLVVARWGIRALTRYSLARSGATFKASELKILEGVDQARPVGVTTAPGGGMFVALAYMAHNEGSPVYPSDLVLLKPRNSAGVCREKVSDPTRRDDGALYTDLDDPSWDIR